MVDKLNIIEDIESEYKKLYNECKKKYIQIRDSIEKILNTFNTIKNLPSEKIDHALKKLIDDLIKPIIDATDSKYSKLYITILCITKKLVTYNLIKQSQTGPIIKLLKDILDSSTEEFMQVKVLETLLPMVNPQVISLTDELVSNVLQMCFKISTFKSQIFKNPSSALFKQLMITVFGFLDGYLRPVITNRILDYEKNNQKEIENENIVDGKEKIENDTDLIHFIWKKYDYSKIDISELFECEVYATSISVIKNLMLVLDGKKKDWIYPSSYSKIMALELLAGIIEQSGLVFIYIKEVYKIISDDLIKNLHKYFNSSLDYMTGLKVVRLSIQIIDKMYIGYDLLPYIFKYSESNVQWQKYLSMECIVQISGNRNLLSDLYQLEENRKYYTDLISSITKLSYSSIVTYDAKAVKGAQIQMKNNSFTHINYIHPSLRLINTNSILTETDSNMSITTTYPNQNIVQKFLYDIFSNLKEAFSQIAIEKNVLSNEKLKKLNEQQVLYKSMLGHEYESIKNSMTVIIINSNDECHCQGYLSIYLTYISLFGSLSYIEGRDSYLNDLCKLAIPNNLENTLEMKEKNLMITKSLLNIVHCNHILDFSSWSLFIETLQKIYLVLLNTNNYLIKPSQEFEIDVIIKNLEKTIRKYDPKYGVGREREVLREESLIIKEDDEKRKKENNLLSSIVEEKTRRGSYITQFSMAYLEKDKEKYLLSNIKQIESKQITEQKNQPQSQSQTQIFIEEKMNDLQILSNAIDSLFVNSNKYELSLLISIMNAFEFNTKKIISENTVINDNLITYLHFNVTKILEICVININYIPFFWDQVTSVISIIAEKNFTNISRFSMDCLTIINMFMITLFNRTEYENYYKTILKSNDSNNDIEKEEKSTQFNFISSWQSIIFKPYISISESINHMNILLNMVYNLGKILQNCGQYLNSDGWEFYFKSLSNMIIKADENFIEQAFKLVETVNTDYLENLPIENIKSFANVLESFALNKKNSNISYLSVSMFWSVMKVIEKYNKAFYVENKLNNQVKETTNDFDDNWKYAFSKMLSINNDNRFEVRKANVSTFKDILITYSYIIDMEVVKEIVIEYFFCIFNKTYAIYESKIKKLRALQEASHKEEALKTKGTRTGSLITDIQLGEFKADSLKIPSKSSNRDIRVIVLSEEEKEWEESVILLSQAIGKGVKALFLNMNKQKEKESESKSNDNKIESIYNSIYNSIVSNFTMAFKFTTPDLTSSILKSLQEIYSSEPEVFFKNFNSIWGIFEELGRFITSDYYLLQLSNLSSGSKMIINVLDVLKEIFIANQSIYNIFNDGKSLPKLLLFLTLLLKSTKSCDSHVIINNPQKHLIDEKNIFDFIEQLNLQIKSKQASFTYHNYLLQYVKYDLSDLHSEAHCRRVLDILDVFYKNKCETSLIQSGKSISLKDLIINLIKETTYICCLRNKNEYVTALIKNNKLPMQLWHYSVFQLIKILKLFLCSKAFNDRKSNVNNNNIGDDDDFDIEEAKTSNYDVWDSMITCFENIFKQSEGKYKNINKVYVNDLFKSCQEMEVLIINFIVNDLLAQSLKIPKEKQIRLLGLLDLGCNFDSYVSLSNQSSSISKICLESLFNLCSYRTEDELRKEIIDNIENIDDYVKIKIKIAKMTTPILLRRCKEYLKSYYDNEIKAGSMPLEKSVIEDVKYILINLKNLNVYPNFHIVDEENFKEEAIKPNEESLKKAIMGNKKSHLFNLMPFFAEFITSKENEIKKIVKDILFLLSKQIES